LNEGFTVFTERKIVGRLSKEGESERHFNAIGGWKDLKYGVSEKREEVRSQFHS